MYAANHKTVIVLDHSPHFGAPSGVEIVLPWLDGTSPMQKSLWTCSLESALEYCRLVWDLFPREKLVRLIASDTEAHSINSWNPDEQNLSHIMDGMADVGVPPPERPQDGDLDYSILHGMRAAIAALGQRTHLQNETIKTVPEGQKIYNDCRVICITSVEDNDRLDSLEDEFLKALDHQNGAIHTFDGLLTVDHCHLVIFNVFPSSVESTVSAHAPKVLSPNLTVEASSIEASHIESELYPLILDYYGLASTTLTNVCIKESRHTPPSKYDVEFIHSSDAHGPIARSELCDFRSLQTVKDGNWYETTCLRPSMLKGEIGAMFHDSVEVHRATPVNSRASFCFTKTLLRGNSYALKVTTKGGGGFISHILTTHGDDIFIHSLCVARPLLEEISSETTNLEDEKREYRIKDFRSFIRQNTLSPIDQSLVEVLSPMMKMKIRLNYQTKHWPITKSSSLLFNLRNYLEPLLTLIQKTALNDDELFQCNNVIYNLNACELKMKPLPLLYDARLVKGRRLEEQYQAAWEELRALVKSNLHSENHKKVYRCLLDCHRNNFGSGGDSEKAKLCRALQELDSKESAWGVPVTALKVYSPTLPSSSVSVAGPSSLYDIINAQQLAKQAEGRWVGRLRSHLYVGNLDKWTASGEESEKPESEIEETEEESETESTDSESTSS